MKNNLDRFSNFYNTKELGFDLELVKFAYRSFKPFFVGNSCLELGPATGYMTKFLLESFDSVVCVEGSTELYKRLPEHPKLSKFNSMFEDFNTTEKFDTIIMNHVLEHLEDPVKVLSRVKSWMNKNSIFIVGVPNAKSFHRLAAVKMGLLKSEFQLNERDIALGHKRIYNFEILQKHVLQSGFQICHSSGIFLKFLSNSQIEKFLDDNIKEAYYALSDDFPENCAIIFVILKKNHD